MLSEQFMSASSRNNGRKNKSKCKNFRQLLKKIACLKQQCVSDAENGNKIHEHRAKGKQIHRFI